MPDRYFNASAVADGDGLSPQTAYASWRNFCAALQNDETGWMFASDPAANRFFDMHNSRTGLLTGKSRVRIRVLPGQGPGGTTPKILMGGLVEVSQGAVTNVGTDLWKFSVPSGVQVAGVTYRYFQTIKASAPCAGAHMGFIPERRTADAAADVTAVTNSSTRLYAQQGVEVFVKIPGTGTTPPAPGELHWDPTVTVSANANALMLTGCTDCTVDFMVGNERMVEFHRIDYRETNGSDGYAVLCNGGSVRNVIRGLLAHYTGDHAWGNLGQGAGQNCNGNANILCISYGTGARNPDSTSVHFADGGPNVFDDADVDCVSYRHGPYQADGSILPPRPNGAGTTAEGRTLWDGNYVGAPNGFYAHANNGSRIAGLKLINCRDEADPAHFGLAATVGYPWTGNDFFAIDCLPPGNILDPLTYAVQAWNCSSENSMGHQNGSRSGVAHIGGTYRANAGKALALFRYDANNFGVFGFTNTTAGAGGYAGYFHCYILNTNHANGSVHAVFTFGSGSTVENTLVRVGCTICDWAEVPNNTFAAFDSLCQASTIRSNRHISINNIFARRVHPDATTQDRARFFQSSFSPSAALVKSVGMYLCNWYTGWNEFRMTDSGAAELDARAEWTAQVDPLARFTDPLLVNPLLGPELQAGSPVLTQGLSAAFAAQPGVNRRTGSNIGAWKNGVWPLPRRDDGSRTVVVAR